MKLRDAVALPFIVPGFSSFFYGFLLAMSNEGAKIRPDGFPLESDLTIWSYFIVGFILMGLGSLIGGLIRK